MGHETPKSFENGQPEGSLDQLIKTAVDTLPAEPTEDDPYVRQGGFRPLTMSGKRYAANGRIEFSPDFEVRNLRQGDFELIFVHNQDHDRSELLIHQFFEDGGLASRTTLSETDEGYRKVWSSGAYTPTAEISSPGSRKFVRTLEAQEAEVIENIVAGALAGQDVTPYLEEFTRVTDEEQGLIEQRQQETQERRRKLEADLKRLDDAERRAHKRARDILIR